jgi:hypothetical protein
MNKSGVESPIQNEQEVEWYMKDLGYKKIGKGGSSLVFTKSGKPYVVKVYQSDRCYEEFLKLARRHPNNPFYPRFYDKVYTLPGNKWKAIKLETLAVASVDDLKNNLPLIACLAIEERKQTNDWKDNTGLADTLQILGYFSDDFDDLLDIYYDATELEKQTAKQVIGLIHRKNCLNDLYISNFMKRGEQLVITDPVV